MINKKASLKMDFNKLGPRSGEIKTTGDITLDGFSMHMMPEAIFRMELERWLSNDVIPQMLRKRKEGIGPTDELVTDWQNSADASINVKQGEFMGSETRARIKNTLVVTAKSDVPTNMTTMAFQTRFAVAQDITDAITKAIKDAVN